MFGSTHSPGAIQSSTNEPGPALTTQATMVKWQELSNLQIVMGTHAAGSFILNSGLKPAALAWNST